MGLHVAGFAPFLRIDPEPTMENEHRPEHLSDGYAATMPLTAHMSAAALDGHAG